MSDFHYVRTLGADGGVDAAEGSAIGIDLESVLDVGLPPFRIALELASAVAEILAIADEDGVMHGDLEPGHVFIDDTGAVSIEGFGQPRTSAPEGRPKSGTDRYGLGALLFALLSPHDLPVLPKDPAKYEDALIDLILLVNLEGLPDHAISDIQWYLVRLLSYEPGDRPTTLEAWRAFASIAGDLDGPEFASWTEAALEGGGERRDADQASRPMPRRSPVSEKDLDETTVSGGPLPKGSLNFEEAPTEDKNTGWWTADGLKNALQRALSSDYMEDPDTGWMPGTPIPALDRQIGPNKENWRSREGANRQPRRAPGQGARRNKPPTPDSTFSDAGSFDDYTDPRSVLPHFADMPEEDARTVAGNLGVPLRKHTPAPSVERTARPTPRPMAKPVPKATPTPVPKKPTPVPVPSRPKRQPTPVMKKDDDTAPEFIRHGVLPDESLLPQKASIPPTFAPVDAATEVMGGAPPPEAPTTRQAPSPQGTPEPAPLAPPIAAPIDAGPVPLPDLSRGPDPFANATEEPEGPNVPMLATLGVLVVMATFLCVGTVGIGGITAIMGFPQDNAERPSTRPRPTPSTRPGPDDPEPEPRPTSLAQVPKPLPAPSNFAMPEPRPQPVRPRADPVRPRPEPVRPAPFRPEPVRPTPAPIRPAPEPFRPAPQPIRPSPTPTPLPSPVPAPFASPAPAPFPTPAPAPFPTPAPAPFPTPVPQPIGGDQLLPTLLPTPMPGPNGEPVSEMQTSMIAHFATATMARDAVIKGDPDEARRQAEQLEFLNPPSTLPPNWQPYVIDLKVEAWMMGNSPDLTAAGFKVAQIASACASCHAGVRAGPTVDPNRVPPRTFPHKDVMRKHSWAVDWMWVGLIANDEAAWARGSKALAESPFASAVLEGFPEPKFVELEDQLHALAVESQTVQGPDERATIYGKLLATCARCHVLYRPESKP